MEHPRPPLKALLPARRAADEESLVQASESFQHSMEEINGEMIESLAIDFAAKVPEKVFSPAEVLSFLLERKSSPISAVSDVEDWVGKTREATSQLREFMDTRRPSCACLLQWNRRTAAFVRKVGRSPLPQRYSLETCYTILQNRRPHLHSLVISPALAPRNARPPLFNYQDPP
jgi:hypothetical protein